MQSEYIIDIERRKSNKNYLFVFYFSGSAVEFVQIAVHVHLELEHRQDGMLIILFVIRAINNAIKDSPVQFVIELIEQPLIERWSNVTYAISTSHTNFDNSLSILILMHFF